MVSIITHEALYDILIKEKVRNELQKIEESFLIQLNSYIEEKELILNSQKEKNTFPEEVKRAEKQLNSIKHLSSELIERRKRKILELALLNSRTPSAANLKNLLPQEQRLYEDVLKALTTHTIQEAKGLKNENHQILIKILEPIPKFIGTDLQIYGPFVPNDVIALSEKIANILITKNKAIKNETP